VSPEPHGFAVPAHLGESGAGGDDQESSNANMQWRGELEEDGYARAQGGTMKPMDAGWR